jgi:hypothetical protein
MGNTSARRLSDVVSPLAVEVVDPDVVGHAAAVAFQVRNSRKTRLNAIFLSSGRTSRSRRAVRKLLRQTAVAVHGEKADR